jgi:GT2 family glycosyltransferase/glycosyltransferase involved in cell wall biosynthesis
MSLYRDRLLPFIETWRAQGRRVAIFGVGPHTDHLYETVPELADVNVIAFLDNNPALQGTTYRDRPICQPAWAEGRADVILCSSFVNERAMADSIDLLECKIVLSHPDRPVASSAGSTFHRRTGSSGMPDVADLRSIAPRRTPDAQPRRQDIVILPIIDWHYRFQRPQQLAVQLAAAGHRVFYVRNVFHGECDASVRLLQDRVFEVTLPSPRPVNIYTEFLGGDVLEAFRQALDRHAARWGLADVLCVVDLPFWWPLASAMRDTHGWRIIYDCMDEHAGFADTSHEMLSSEQALVAHADLVVASSRPLFERLTHARQRLLLPNAADYDHFARAMQPVPGWLAALPRPIVGYYGAVAEWFDGVLLANIARARPAWNFVVIGNASSADLDDLRRLPNVHMRVEQPYEELPAMLQAFDVCIIPFKRSPLTDATNPVKLYEYWSAGKPVVATRLSELEQLGGDVHLASSVDEWLMALDMATGDSAPASAERRRAKARENTWAARASALVAGASPLHPQASIVIVTYNGLEVTRLCLASVFDKTRYPSFDIVVVDNGSTDGTREYLTQLALDRAEVRVVFNERNVGFAAANNQGAAMAQGDVIVFLNNDTIVSPDWLSRLARHLDDPTIGLVGPVTNWCGNEARIAVTYHGLHELDAFAHDYTSGRLGRCVDIPMLAFFCVAIRRRLFEQLGPLDEAFGTGMFEDDDYALRVRDAGLRCVCAEDAFVHHWGRASFSKLDQDSYDALFARNRNYFERKWRRPWTPHQARSSADTDAVAAVIAPA